VKFLVKNMFLPPKWKDRETTLGVMTRHTVHGTPHGSSIVATFLAQLLFLYAVGKAGFTLP
jgi:hypothetical protein